jgi:hypothetical protein
MTPHEAFYRKKFGYYPSQEDFLSLDKTALLKWFAGTEEWYIAEVQRVRLEIQLSEGKRYKEKLDHVSTEYATKRKRFSFETAFFLCFSLWGIGLVMLLISWAFFHQ